MRIHGQLHPDRTFTLYFVSYRNYSITERTIQHRPDIGMGTSASESARNPSRFLTAFGPPSRSRLTSSLQSFKEYPPKDTGAACCARLAQGTRPRLEPPRLALRFRRADPCIDMAIARKKQSAFVEPLRPDAPTTTNLVLASDPRSHADTAPRLDPPRALTRSETIWHCRAHVTAVRHLPARRLPVRPMSHNMRVGHLPL